MNRRLVVFLIVFVALIAVVVGAVVLWPEQDALRGWPALRVGALPGAGGLVHPAGGVLVAPTNREALPVFGLRPFGLQRAGGPGIAWHVVSLLAWLVLAAIALFAAPRRVGVLTRVISASWGQRLLAFVIGLLGYLGLGLLGFQMFINVVGWPVILILSLAVYLATAFGLVSVSLALGTGVCHRVRLDDRGPLFHLGVGGSVLFLGSIIPYVGWLVVGCSACLGFGAVLWTRAGSLSGWSLDEVNL